MLHRQHARRRRWRVDHTLERETMGALRVPRPQEVRFMQFVSPCAFGRFAHPVNTSGVGAFFLPS